MWPGFGSAWGATAKAMWGGLSGTAKGSIAGSLAGGIYGAFSDNTSVLGGAMMGGAMGAGGGYLASKMPTRSLWHSIGRSPIMTKPVNPVASSRTMSRIIKRGTHPLARNIPPGIRIMNRQSIPGIGGRGSIWSGARRNILKGLDARVF